MDAEQLTLDDVLHDDQSDLYLGFKAYLEKTFCYENLAFWNSVREYEQCWKSDETREETKIQKCKMIRDTFICAKSRQEINIRCQMREAILRRIQQGDIGPDIFHDAKKAVYDLMHHNSFLQWTTSPASPATCSPPSTPSPTMTSFPDSWPLPNGNRFSYSSVESTTSDYDTRRPARYLSVLHRVRSLLPIRLNRHPKTPLEGKLPSFSSRKMTR